MNDRSNSLVAEIEEVEDQLDVALMKLARMESANEERIPGLLVDSLCDGANPTRVWREHRGVTPEAVAEAASITPDLLAAIERGEAEPGLRVMKRVARALRVDLDDLVPWPQEGEPVGRPAVSARTVTRQAAE